MNKISKLLTILCFIGFGLCLTGCSDGSSSASTKGLNIYLFGAPADSHWNIWCWNKDTNTPYSSKSWDESKASGWEFSIDEIDAEKGCLVKNLDVPKSATLGLLFVNDKGDKQTADITVLTSVLKNAHELYFVYGLTEFYTSFDDIAGIKNATISSADGKELSGSIYGYTELLDDNDNTIYSPNKIGEITCTGFNNYVFPLIRYKTADYAAYASHRGKCTFEGRLFESIEGRWRQEMLLTSKGNKISMTSINFHSDIFDNIKNYQFFQDKAGFVTLRIVRKESYTQKDEYGIKSAMLEKLGDDTVLDIQYVKDIEKTANGKFRYVISKIK